VSPHLSEDLFIETPVARSSPLTITKEAVLSIEDKGGKIIDMIFITINPFSAYTRRGSVENDVIKMRMHAYSAYWEIPVL
jgi:hypothetical protein